MLSAILKRCVEKRVLAVVITIAVALYGFKAFRSTPIEAFPDVTNVQVTVIAQMPGLAPEEIERQITVPLERALNGTPGMIQLRSESLFGLSLVSLTFEDAADTFKARTLVIERIGSAELPQGVVPELAPEATPLGEVYQYVLESNRHSLDQLRATQDTTVVRVMKQIPGVADVVSFGGFIKEFHVEVDPVRLEAYGLRLSEVTEALRHANLNVGGGFLRQGEQQLVVRSVGYLQEPGDLKQVVLESKDGTPVTVGDVARVTRAHTPRMGTAALNLSKDSVEGFVLLRRGENPTQVLDAIHAKVAELNQRILPEGMHISTFYDRSTLVEHTLSTVYDNLLHGFVLIVGLVWLFIRNIRGSLVVACVIPLSLLTAFVGLSFLGLPANLISMGAIDFGILVDGAIVLVENIVHEVRHERPQSARHMHALVVRSALAVARPTFFAMAIIIAAMIPVYTLERVEGRIFRPLALTYTFALVGALVFSLTAVPALCAILLRPKDADVRDPAFVERLRNGYARTLERLLTRRWAAIGVAAGLLAVAGLAASRLGTEFLPQLDEGDVVVFVEMPPSISLEEGSNVLLEVRRRFLQFPEVLATLSEQGRPEDGTDNEGVNMSETFVRFRPPESWPPGVDKERLVEDMRASVEQIPGVRFNFSQPIKDNVEEAVSGVRGQVVLKIFGPDLQAMRTTLQHAVEALRSVPGITDLDLYRDTTVPQLQIQLDRAALARSGVGVETAQTLVETALGGSVVTDIWEGERQVPVRVRLAESERTSPERIADIAVPTSGPSAVPLRELAHIGLADGRASINREANSRYMALKFNVEGRDMGATIQDAIAKVDAEVKPPDGHFFVWTGEFENQQRAMQRLEMIIPVALLVVAGLLFMALNSMRGALMILVLAPLAMTGGVLALWLSHTALSVSAAVGFIALLGQVSLAGLLTLSAIDDQRQLDPDVMRAIVSGTVHRFRAILMAGLLAMLGLLPMAVSSGVGSETQRPFALVIVGGMVTTLVVTLFVLPVLYSRFAGERRDDEEAEA